LKAVASQRPSYQTPSSLRRIRCYGNRSCRSLKPAGVSARRTRASASTVDAVHNNTALTTVSDVSIDQSCEILLRSPNGAYEVPPLPMRRGALKSISDESIKLVDKKFRRECPETGTFAYQASFETGIMNIWDHFSLFLRLFSSIFHPLFVYVTVFCRFWGDSTVGNHAHIYILISRALFHLSDARQT